VHLPREIVDRIVGMFVSNEVSFEEIQIDEHYRFPSFLQIDHYYRNLYSAWYYYYTHFIIHGPEINVLEKWCRKFLEAMPEDHRTELGHLEIQHTSFRLWESVYGPIILVDDFYGGMNRK